MTVYYNIIKCSCSSLFKQLFLHFNITTTSEYHKFSQHNEFEFYKKKAKNSLFVNPKSALPKCSKIHIMYNERKHVLCRNPKVNMATTLTIFYT